MNYPAASAAGGAILAGTEAQPSATIPAAQSVQRSMSGNRHQVQFHGNGGEFFRIWIVNLVLSILTLGIYSAWAKVRTNRYFYGNTEVAGSHFEYLAEPMQILKGRLVAVALFALFGVAAELMPELYLLLLVGFYLALPLIVVASLRFAMKMTAWRGIRFSHRGSVGSAYLTFLLLPLLIPFTLLLILPYLALRQNQFVFNNLWFGRSCFKLNIGAGVFYKIYGIATLIFLLVGGGLGYMVASNIAGVGEEAAAAWSADNMGWILGISYVLMSGLFTYVSAASARAVINGLTIEKHGFDSTITTPALAWLYVSNLFLVVLTLGLAAPWAKVRMARYHAETTTLVADGSIDDFVAAQQSEISSVGEGVSDIFEVDIAL
ncbi:YjgN family protein [Allohahella marinimesophila]|uniref:DUF898 family protein n=1 Tax=Allohahella marinimesophila TaxID=1054972 RepID=A0ABP7PB88_9GAMM